MATFDQEVRVFSGVEALQRYFAKNVRQRHHALCYGTNVFATGGAVLKIVHRPTFVQRMLHIARFYLPSEFVLQRTRDADTLGLIGAITGATTIEPREYAVILRRLAKRLELARIKEALRTDAEILAKSTHVGLFVHLWPSLSSKEQELAGQSLIHHLAASYDVLARWGNNSEREGRSWEGVSALRVKAASILGHLNYTDAASGMIAMLGSSEEPEVLSACAEALGRWRDKRAIEILLDLLGYCDGFPRGSAWKVREAATNALRSIGASPNEWQLGYERALKAGDQRVRLEAVKALGELGDRTAIPILLDLIASGAPFFQDVEGAISKLGGCSNAELVNAYVGCIRNRQYTAIRRVAELKDTRVVPALIEVLFTRDEHYWKRESAALALKQLRAVEALPALEESLKCEDPTVQVFTGDLGNGRFDTIASPAFEAIRDAIDFLAECV